MQPPSLTTIPLRFRSNGRLALVGSGCDASAPWLLKAAKMPKVPMLSLTPPAKATSTSPEPQHLGGMDEAEVPGGAGRAEGVGRAGDAEVERNLARGVVGDRARIVMVATRTCVSCLKREKL